MLVSSSLSGAVLDSPPWPPVDLGDYWSLFADSSWVPLEKKITPYKALYLHWRPTVEICISLLTVSAFAYGFAPSPAQTTGQTKVLFEI